MEHDPGALEELRALGLRAVPVTLVGERAVVGFNPTALAEALGLRVGAASGPDPRWLLQKYETVLAAALRATRQVPDERLDWKSPERDRTLRQFTFHLFDRPHVALRSATTGEYTREMVRRYETEALQYPSVEAIARYGEGVVQEVRAFLERVGPRELGQPVRSYFSGTVTVGELMDLALGHSAHHLRQLYHYLGLLGVAPDRPLTQRDLEGIAVPTELF